MSGTFSRIQNAIQSEHCSYKSTKKWLSMLYTEGQHVIQGPGENAGLLDIGNGYALALRIESHNHPSYIDPYEGAATGVGGILRDIFTMGARPIALLDFLRFGVDEGSNTYLLPEVIRGISDYGNTMGIPTVGGDILFHKSYEENCLVNVCAMGLVHNEDIIYGHALEPGLDLIYVGARTGRDGIGGSEMASAVLTNVDPSAIQSSDPYLEKLLMEACCELAQRGLVHGMQDMGAAGLLCSTSEVVYRGRKKTGLNLGCVVYAYNVPIKDPFMNLGDILLSESQERMLIVSEKQNTSKILEIFHKWDLEATIIGATTDDGIYSVLDAHESVRIPMTDLFPDLEEEWEKSTPVRRSPLEKPHRDIIRSIWTQYDWMVGLRTLKGPNSTGQYAILDIPEVEKELIITWGEDLDSLNTHMHVEKLFIDCVRTIHALKGTPIGVTNCLNFGHPQSSMTDFIMTVDSLGELCRNSKIPVVSGNVSLYNCSPRGDILPTPILVMVGLRDKQQKQQQRKRRK